MYWKAKKNFRAIRKFLKFFIFLNLLHKKPLKGGISIYADFGSPRYVLWCYGGICHQVLTFFKIGCGHTVLKATIWAARKFQNLVLTEYRLRATLVHNWVRWFLKEHSIRISMHLCFNKIFRLLLIVMLHAQKYRGDSTEYSSAVGNAIKCKCTLKTMWTRWSGYLGKKTLYN